MDIKALLRRMTLEEKASLCIGGSYMHTLRIPRLNIPNIRMSDGPSGINKTIIYQDYLLPEEESKESILFPSSSCTCCSFDKDLMYYMGENLGDQMIKEGISIILAPGVNIKRSPLCGRNFEYFSEDPYLSTKIAGSLIRGVQSKGVGCCIKHFACNNQELYRQFSTSDVDERTLREIYLASFEGAVKESSPWAVMSSYNSINRIPSSENHELLTKILRDEWKWNINDSPDGQILSGIVISDWWGTHNRINALKAGLDLEMPGSNKRSKEGTQEIVKSVKNGDLDVKIVDQTVERLLNVIFKAQELINKSKSDPSIQFGKKMINVPGFLDQQHQVATKIAEESIVLLKNEDSILPLPLKCDDSKRLKILFVGSFAVKPHKMGYGSAFVKAYNKTRPFDCVQSLLENQKNIEIEYIEGFNVENGQMVGNEDEVIELSANSDIVVVFAGTFKHEEIENKDRKTMELPADENELIFDILKVNKNVVVVLQNGSPVEMPWANDVKAILETYFSGEGCGEATAKILFGLVNPSGHLAETFPIQLKDNPSFGNFSQSIEVQYTEGIFVGYRHYDTKKIDVQFPFGHGLSYTTFEYKNIRLIKDDHILKFTENDENYSIQVDVVNTGNVTGKTVPQLYVSDLVQEVKRPVKELKGFEKVELMPGEMKTVTFLLNKRSFAWWNVEIHDWHVSPGNYQIVVGQSSRDANSLVLNLEIQ